MIVTRVVVLAPLLCAAMHSAFAAGFKDVSGTSRRDYVTGWNTPTGARLTKPIIHYIYDKAGDGGASLGNACGVAEYVAVVCKEKGGATVGEAVKESLRRQADGIEPPEPKVTCPP